MAYLNRKEPYSKPDELSIVLMNDENSGFQQLEGGHFVTIGTLAFWRLSASTIYCRFQCFNYKTALTFTMSILQPIDLLYSLKRFVEVD